MKIIIQSLLFILVMVVTSLPVCTQGVTTDSLYWEQTPPGDSAIVFAPGIISLSNRRETKIVFSPGGLECLISVGENNQFKILYSNRYSGHWLEPAPASFIPFNHSPIEPFFTPDSLHIFYTNGADIYMCTKVNQVWSTPVRLNAPVNTKSEEYHPTVTFDGTLYFCSTRDGSPPDLFRSKYESGNYTTVEKLDKVINMPHHAWDPFIAPDESYIIFTSIRSDGYGQEDQYISYNKNGRWTNPKNLGTKINTNKIEWGSYIGPDNKYYFFSRPNGWGPNIAADIYWVSASFIEILKHTNFDPYLNYQIPDQSFQVGHQCSYRVPDSTFIDDDGNNTLTYSATLSNGNPLPTWLSFDPTTLTFSGTPTQVTNISIKVIATDNADASVFCSFIIDASWGNTIVLSTIGAAYKQNFDTLASSGTSSTMPTGWIFTETGSNANTTYTAGNGSENVGETYSFGSTSTTERALGSLVSDSLFSFYGASFTNTTGSTINSLTIAYAGEEWRLGATGRADTIQFQLSTDATSLIEGTYSNYSFFDFATPTTNGTIGALDGNSSTNRRIIIGSINGLNITNGSTFFLRWIDKDVPGPDDGLAVDDFSLTPLTLNPTVIGRAEPSTAFVGNTTLFIGAVTPGTNPTSTSLSVIGDLSSIGGSSTQQFYDDGTHGDVTTSDNIFSFQASILTGTLIGLKQIPITVSDAQLRSGVDTIDVTVAVCPTITLTPSVLLNGIQYKSYNQTISASGGTSPYSYSVTAGTLPSGITLASNGNLSGTPSVKGQFIFTVTATDLNSCVGSREYTFTIDCPAITLTPTTLPKDTVGKLYSQTITASGGTSPYSYSITTGTLPTGITLASNGNLSGTPTVKGQFIFTVTAIDLNSCVGSRGYTLTIDCPTITLSPTTLPKDTVGKIYSQVITATGGTPPYSFNIIGGNLPDGLSLNSDGTISGTLSKADKFNFTIIAIDANGCTSTSVYIVTVDRAEEIVEIPLSAKWNLVSNPVGVINDSVSFLFPGTISGASEYTISGYQISARLINGTGYWMKFASPETVLVEGSPRYEDTIDVMDGWNIIGSLTRGISVSSITGVGTSIKSDFFGYGEGYNMTDSIIPGKGYWVKVNPEGKLHLLWSSSPIAAAVRSSRLPELTNNMSEIIFENQAGQKRSLYFGLRNEEIESKFDLPPTPPEGIFDVRFKSQRFAETYTSHVSKQLQYPIQISGAGSPVDIRWNSAFVTDHIVRLQIQESGKKLRNVKLTGNGEIKIDDPDNTKLTLVLSDRNEIPTEYKLHQNYPNPFNPTTTIEFEIPKAGRYKLYLYNALGQLVKEIADKEYDAGYCKETFNAAGMSSGVYTYRLTGNDVSIVHKMVILR
ncbi:MAG: putative Ig domain-containing protein [Ignavibacteriales bacterium]|nr:putative Ig domain-containing protein [Ignavibacteriales bacterium]